MDDYNEDDQMTKQEFQALYLSLRHDWKLLDDGTLGTVIQCRSCKQIERCDSRDSAAYVMQQEHMFCNE